MIQSVFRNQRGTIEIRNGRIDLWSIAHQNLLRIGQRRIEFLHRSLRGSQSRCDLRSPVAVIGSDVAQDSSCIVQDGNDFA